MLRAILALLFAILYLIIGIPVLGIEWIISKFNRKAADISQLRMVQWAFRVILFIRGTKVTVIGEENVSLYMVNPKAPCFIKDDEGKFIYLILPVNFNNAAN